MAENALMQMLMGPHPLVENHQLMLHYLLNLRGCPWHLLQVTGDVPLRWHLDACAGERAPHNWCIMLPVSQRVQPGVYTLMALSWYRDALVQQLGPERPLVSGAANPHCLLPSCAAAAP